MATNSESTLRPEQAAGLLRDRPDLRLLDVRTPGEYEAAHIQGAHNVPLDSLDAHVGDIRANLDGPLLLVCQSGSRARKAEEMLSGAGLAGCHVLEGGLTAWMSAGLPVTRGRQRISLERQVRIVAGAIAGTGGLLAVLVHPAFGLVPAFIGSGLVFAGLTDTCGMGLLLSRLPYNRPRGTDTAAVVRALRAGGEPAATTTARTTR